MTAQAELMERRLLLVHAHPDDESIATGGVMARYAAEGAHVALVTCTRGEEGEIVPADLQHLGTGKLLADVRTQELARAMAELGVYDFRFLGPYEDSGMFGTPENDKPTAFWNADLDEAVGHLVKVLHEVQPQVVVTYDEHGGYGHPDHIQAHRVTLLALEAVADALPAPKLYYIAWGGPERKRLEVEHYVEAGCPGGYELPDLDTPPAHPAPAPTTTVDVHHHVDRKLAAMRAHRTQLTTHGRFFALSNNVMHEVHGVERFTLARGTLGAVDPATGHEVDLFAGTS